MQSTENYYNILDLPLDATPEEIRSAYRELARKYHPDTSQDASTATKFLQVQRAYEVLSDPEQKAAYDASLPSSFITPSVILSTVYSRSLLQRSPDPQLVYALIKLSPHPSTANYANPLLNVCLVIDKSTSMKGAAMDTVKSTAIELVRQLRPEDILSIVAFSDRAEVVVPAQANLDRASVETAIHMLNTGGGTEIFKGLEAGYGEVHRYQSPRYINHIILITDGRTYGDEDACEALADLATRQRIGISAMGIGSKWNDVFLDMLATKTGGSTMFISRPKDVETFLKDKFKGFEACFADRVILNYETGSNVELRYAFRLQPEASALELSSPMQLGAIQKETSLDVVFEFLISAIPPETRQLDLLNGRISVEIPNRADPRHALRLSLTRPTGNDPDQMPPPQTIIQAMSQLTLYRMQERARQDVKNGNINQATRILQHLSTSLLAQGKQQLAQSVLEEARYLQQYSSFSEDGEKRLKYGTRALFLPPFSKE